MHSLPSPFTEKSSLTGTIDPLEEMKQRDWVKFLIFVKTTLHILLYLLKSKGAHMLGWLEAQLSLL